MDDGVGLMPQQQRADQSRIADVAVHEYVTRIAVDVGQIRAISSIC
jgi:hypothetical protein